MYAYVYAWVCTYMCVCLIHKYIYVYIHIYIHPHISREKEAEMTTNIEIALGYMRYGRFDLGSLKDMDPTT